MKEAIPSLRTISSEAEFCLESHWAEYIMNGGDPLEVFERLRSFPYHDNYEQLTRMELCAISSVGPVPRKIAFIGSGPLPLTSLCLLRTLRSGLLDEKTSAYPHGDRAETPSNFVVLNIDHNESAIAASLSLSMKLGDESQGMEFICTEADSTAVDLREFDAVYLAALVGLSQAEKEDILISIADRMRDGATMVVRTSWGLRSCLYPELDMSTERLLQRFELCLVVHPYGRVINSVIVARVKHRADGVKEDVSFLQSFRSNPIY